MPRKPVHLEMAGGKSPRQRMWEVMRRLKGFTLRELRGELPGSIPTATVRSYVQALHAGGHLLWVGEEAPGGARYELASDKGIEAPRVRKDGSAVTQGQGNEALWGAMEALGTFNTRVLASMAGASLETAKTYCAHLHRAGYLVMERKGKGQGKGGIASTYRLLRSKVTGPRPPMITRLKTVYDPNTGAIVWQQDPQEVLDD